MYIIPKKVKKNMKGSKPTTFSLDRKFPENIFAIDLVKALASFFFFDFDSFLNVFNPSC